MTTKELLSEKREEILRIAVKHGVTGIRVFGSAARGDDQVLPMDTGKLVTPISLIKYPYPYFLPNIFSNS